MPKPLEEKTVELHNGTRAAIATLHRFANGWVIDVIAEPGRPDIEEQDHVFASYEEAARAADSVWIPQA